MNLGQYVTGTAALPPQLGLRVSLSPSEPSGHKCQPPTILSPVDIGLDPYPEEAALHCYLSHRVQGHVQGLCQAQAHLSGCAAVGKNSVSLVDETFLGTKGEEALEANLKPRQREASKT